MNYRSFGGIPLRFERGEAADADVAPYDGAAFAPLPAQARPSAAELYPLLGAAVPEARSVRLDSRVGPSVAYTDRASHPAPEFTPLDNLAVRALSTQGRPTPLEPGRAPPLPSQGPARNPPLAPQSQPPQTVAPASRGGSPAAPSPDSLPAPVARAARPLMTSLLGASTRQGVRPAAPPPAPIAQHSPPAAPPAGPPPAVAEPAPIAGDPRPSPFERMRQSEPPQRIEAAPKPMEPPAPRPVSPPPAPPAPPITPPPAPPPAPPIAAAPIPPAPIAPLAARPAKPATHAMADVFRTLSAAPLPPSPPARDRS